jgi:hypothetical protein
MEMARSDARLEKCWTFVKKKPMLGPKSSLSQGMGTGISSSEWYQSAGEQHSCGLALSCFFWIVIIQSAAAFFTRFIYKELEFFASNSVMKR